MKSNVNMAGQSLEKPRVKLQVSVLLALSVSHLLVDIISNVIPLMLTLMQEAFQLSYTQLGAIVTVNMIFASFIQPVFGYLSDRKPSFWLTSVGALLAGVGMIIFAFAPSYIWLLVGVAVSGIGVAAFHPEAGRTVSFTTDTRKGFAQSVFQVGGNVGQALAPLMVPLFLVYTGVRGAWLFIIIAATAAWLMYRITPWMKERIVVEKNKKKVTRTGENHLSSAVVLTFVTILRSTVVIGVSSFLPLYYVNVLGTEIGPANTYIFIFMLAGSIGTFVGGPLADRLGDQKMIVWTMLLSIPFLIWLPSARGALAVVVIATLGFILVSTTAISVVYAQRLMPGKAGMATGLMIGFAYGTAGLGISGLGYFADMWGIEKIFPVLTVLLIIGFLLTLFLPKDEELNKQAILTEK